MGDFRRVRRGRGELTVPEAFNCSKELDMMAMIKLRVFVDVLLIVAEGVVLDAAKVFKMVESDSISDVLLRSPSFTGSYRHI
jgi:hypothetical protein